jgi:hypothetical protein
VFYIQQNLSKPNSFGTEEFVQFRQVFGLHRFKLHRHLVDGTVNSVWFRQVFGLLRVLFRQVSHYFFYIFIGEYKKDELLEAARSGNEDKLMSLLTPLNVNCHASDGRKVNNIQSILFDTTTIFKILICVL